MSAIPLVYIAGPFSGSDGWKIERNVRRAEALAYEVARLGAAPICPHTNLRYLDTSVTYDFMCAATLEMMRRCDAVIFTSDWESSRGARGEHAEAVKLGMPIFVDTAPTAEGLRALRDWMARREVGR